MKMIVNLPDKRLNNITAMPIRSVLELRQYFQKDIDYLSSHNKNYTVKQYYMIQELAQLFDSLEFEEVNGSV